MGQRAVRGGASRWRRSRSAPSSTTSPGPTGTSRPALNPDTGLPVSFLELDPGVAAELWRHGPPRLIAQSRWAALLATMHGRRLSELRDVDALDEPAAGSVRTLRAEFREREAELAGSLRADPELVARNSDLVWAWDGLSLALLLDWAPHTLRAVPAAGRSRVDIVVRAVPERDGLVTLSLSPWPFADPAGVIVETEGRRLVDTYASEDALHAALAAAPWETVRFWLVPAPAEPLRRRAQAAMRPAAALPARAQSVGPRQPGPGRVGREELLDLGRLGAAPRMAVDDAADELDVGEVPGGELIEPLLAVQRRGTGPSRRRFRGSRAAGATPARAARPTGRPDRWRPRARHARARSPAPRRGRARRAAPAPGRR